MTQQITGKFDPKRAWHYLEKAHKHTHIYVMRCEEDENAFFVSDRHVLLKAPVHLVLHPYCSRLGIWEKLTFPEGKEIVPREGGPDCAALWRSQGLCEMKPLQLTCDLLEVVGQRGKHGMRCRKFLLEGEERPIYIDDRITDVFSPDLDELEGFLFETAGREKPVRVSAHNGIIAYVMPLYTKDR